ncbi:MULTISPECIES: CRTAC1 family protein [unclassified Schlesneria]|uniref:CRTAC1 family protein n=1 Tax=unclassified Schlesneria TaxID=2762017 RepID=UPI002F0C635C
MPRWFHLGICVWAVCGCTSKTSTAPVDSSTSTVSVTKGAPESTVNRPRSEQPIANPVFADVAEQSGLNFVYDNGEQGKVLMVEATGGGAGWIDYDGDHLLDLYLCQGGNPVDPSSDTQPLDQLFRQVEPGRFERVTVPATIHESQYSQGVSVADFDDDGFDDVYVSNVGPNSLFRNMGDGTFIEIANSAGVANPLWSASSAWGDLDGDGDLDLYVCNYVDYDVHNPVPCLRADGRPGTCHPKNMTGVPDECYFNQGDGTFTAEAEKRGLFGPENKGLGVVIADLNNDNLPDIYVTNDTSPNFLFINQGHGQFSEMAMLLGCAVSREGHPQASMGIAAGDFDHNGWLDLYSTHFTKESNTLYKNLGPTGFQDVTGLVGLHTPVIPFLGFGTVMTDFNQDGREDIFIANGHIDDWSSQGDLHEMPAQLFSFAGTRFVEFSQIAGPYFQRKGLGRGVASGDFDNDGDWDLAVVHQNSPTALLRNESVRGHWLKLRFQCNTNRRGVGVRVTLRQGEKTLTQQMLGGNSYCSAHEPALIFGLGDDSSPCSLEIRWPDGTVQQIPDVTADSMMLIQQPRSSATE